jgi:hypothetical protein
MLYADFAVSLPRDAVEGRPEAGVAVGPRRDSHGVERTPPDLPSLRVGKPPSPRFAALRARWDQERAGRLAKGKEIEFGLAEGRRAKVK